MAEQNLTFKFVMGDRKNTQYLYIVEEKQLYTKNVPGKSGIIYRCANRQCKSRVIVKNDLNCIKLPTAQPHNHDNNCEQRFIDLVAVQKMKNDAIDLHNIASGSTITKSREIYKSAIIE